MQRFGIVNLERVIKEIEIMERNHENIWVPIGILEYMYDDDYGFLDQYFHLKPSERSIEHLINQLYS